MLLRSFSTLHHSIFSQPSRFSLRSKSLFSSGNYYSTQGVATELTLNQKRDALRLPKLRNIGISAHIDSGKTTLTERILYYTGRIKEIHEVKGKDGIGAKMDSMDLEREKGITIQSAATFVSWKSNHINIIDTPGHVDFTIEVERALRVLDGAVLVICAVGAVQSQTFTVDRQMRRYQVPRIVFINKCDRLGADPWNAINLLRQKLGMKCAALQVPIGLGNALVGIYDILKCKAYFFHGDNGQQMVEDDIPENMMPLIMSKRVELLSQLADIDDVIMEKMLTEEEISLSEIKDAIRRTCIKNQFVPILMGSAAKNKGVQLLLDAVLDYLPSPADVKTVALDTSNNEEEVEIFPDSSKSLIAFPFKIRDDKFGQFTWIRVYQGTIKRGDTLSSLSTEKKIRISRLVRMHSEEIEEIDRIEAGDIAAVIGPEMPVGVTFTNNKPNLVMSSMYIPEPVISFSITTKSKDQDKNLMKALRRFQSEDPTFTVVQDEDTNEMLICGMGELHLDIYIERLRREYGVLVVIGRPRVAYRETISDRGKFDYLHKKQTGGQGQFAKVSGYLEPIDEDEGKIKEFVDHTIGGSIPPQYIPAIAKGYEDMVQHGPLCGFPVTGVRMVIDNGASHSVDSSEMAFRTATHNAFKQGFINAGPKILEPWMIMEVAVPSEFQASVIGGINRRRGQILETDGDGDFVTIRANVSLSSMFGYATEVRSATQGKATFTMEYEKHLAVSKDDFAKITEKYRDHANTNF